MKLVLSAWIGSHNLGDEAIAEVIIDMLEHTIDVEQLTVLSINPTKTNRMTKKQTTLVRQANFSAYWQALRYSDALLLGGGGIIQDESSVINLIFYYIESWVAKYILRKPVVWIFVGVGPIHSWLGKRLLYGMRKLTAYALVRDKESAHLLRQNRFKHAQIIEAYDIVFNLPVPTSAVNRYKGDYLLFCPRDWFFVKTFVPTRFALKRARHNPHSNLQIYRQQLVRLVEAILQDNPDLNIVGVAFFYSQDLDLLQWTKHCLKPQYRERFIVEMGELLPTEFLSVAQQAQAVLGVRLHSLILGALVRRPLAPLVYSAKVSNLVNYLGLGAYTTMLDKPDFNLQSAVERTNKAMHAQPPDATMLLSNIQDRNRVAFNELMEQVRHLTG